MKFLWGTLSIIGSGVWIYLTVIFYSLATSNEYFGVTCFSLLFLVINIWFIDKFLNALSDKKS